MSKTIGVLKSLAYPFAAFPRGTYAAFDNSLLPLYIAMFTNNTALIGFLVTLSAFQGAVAPLIIGPLTDQTHAKIGRRKVYILIGSALTGLLLLLFPFAHTLTLLIIFIILTGFANNIPSAPHLAMITMNARKDKRAQVVALIGVCFLLGQVVMTILALIFWSKTINSGVFIALALLFTFPSIPLLLFSHDEKSPHEISTKMNMSSLLSFFKDKQRNIYMLSQLFLWFGVNSVVPFFTLFIKTYLRLPQQKAILFYLVIVVASGLFAYPFALLGRKLSDNRVFQFGLAFLFVAGILGIFAKQMPELIQFMIAFCAGVGNAATSAFSYAIFSRIVPEERIGLASGVHTVLIAGLAPFAALLSGTLISHFNYPVMFVTLTITTAISIFLINRSHVH